VLVAQKKKDESQESDDNEEKNPHKKSKSKKDKNSEIPIKRGEDGLPILDLDKERKLSRHEERLSDRKPNKDKKKIVETAKIRKNFSSLNLSTS